ncbi:MAG: hypothetical protein R3F39_16745 [Myxococcota bacterium]
MKSFMFWLAAILLLAAALWMFHTSSQFLLDHDYLAGLLHVLVGLAVLRAGVEMARLGVVLRLRSR